MSMKEAFTGQFIGVEHCVSRGAFKWRFKFILKELFRHCAR